MRCVFCDIIARKSPSFIFWEDSHHLAFLSIFPNTRGTSVVVPKKHYPSNIWNLPDEVRIGLIRATVDVNKILCQKLDVERTAMIWEGYGVDHAHAKLFPLHGTKANEVWRPINSEIRTLFPRYKGYVSSHDGPRATDEELKNVCDFLSSVQKANIYKNG